MNKLINKNYNTLIITLLILGCFLRFYGFNTQGYWFDEWVTLWYSNPNFEWSNFYNFRKEYVPVDSKEYDATPKLYFYILRVFFNIFGYTAENGRIFTATFSILSIFVSFFLILLLTKNKNTHLISVFLISFNPFLIWEAQETRVQSVVLFFSILNIFLFIKFLKKNNFFYGGIFLVSVIFLLSLYPVTFVIILAQLLFLINYHKRIIIIIRFFIVYFLSAIFYLYYNHDYLLNILQYTGHNHSKLHWHFFVGYFFNVFFGSTVLGGFFLILFVSILFLNRKVIYNILNIQLLFIIISTTYFLILIYSFRNGVMAPRYIIFLVPLIIIFISIGLKIIDFKYKNYLYGSLIFFSILTLIYKIDDRPIKKPPTQNIIKIIALSGIKNVTTNINNTRLFSNYLVTHKAFFENNLFFIDLNQNTNFPTQIWLICSNNMRADIGTNHNFPSPDCYSDILGQKLKITKSIKDLDLQISLYEK